MSAPGRSTPREVRIAAGRSELHGNLAIPDGTSGLVLFVHGSGSSRHSPRNVRVAQELQRAGLATLLFDLLTPEEEARDALTREHRFDIALLSQRLVDATHWVRARQDTRDLPIGYFGASTGSAAALVAAAFLDGDVGAVVSRGGRPDLAGEAALTRVSAPTLLVVGGRDHAVLELNQHAYALLRTIKELAIVAGASHLFEEPGTLDEAARLAARWFCRHLVVTVPAP